MQGQLFADVEELYLTHAEKPYRSHYPLNYSWYYDAYVNGEPGSEQIENDPEHELSGTPTVTYDIWLEVVDLSYGFYVGSEGTWYNEGDRMHLSNVPYHHVHVNYWIWGASYDEDQLIYAVFRLIDQRGRYGTSDDFWVVFNRPVPGDFDANGHIEGEDFGHLCAALTGPGTPQENPRYEDADLDGDLDVDLADSAVFQRCYSGSEDHPDPRCASRR
ncbi:MAG: hypothetical protein V1790_08060 [Planctomycetota bacterium]